MMRWDLASEAIRICEEAQAKGVMLRIMGACAVRIHCPKYASLHADVLKRELTDLDFVTYKEFERTTIQTIKGFGYKLEISYPGRSIFTNPETGITLDLFLDQLRMCHDINFRDRLEVSYPTIPLAELVLEKTQIVKINEKDIKDLIVILVEHKVGETDAEEVNGRYIAKVLASDWGFYYTVTTNLEKIRSLLLEKYASLLSEEDKAKVIDNIKKLVNYLESEPKSLAWRMRARIGTKKKWYREVEEAQLGSLAEYLIKSKKV
ncbi:MAG: hypothetical protein QXU95_03900 [Candidatus Bathyarchaeia archaeon]